MKVANCFYCGEKLQPEVCWSCIEREILEAAYQASIISSLRRVVSGEDERLP